MPRCEVIEPGGHQPSLAELMPALGTMSHRSNSGVRTWLSDRGGSGTVKSVIGRPQH